MLCSVFYSGKPFRVLSCQEVTLKKRKINDKMFVTVKLPASKAIAGP